MARWCKLHHCLCYNFASSSYLQTPVPTTRCVKTLSTRRSPRGKSYSPLFAAFLSTASTTDPAEPSSWRVTCRLASGLGRTRGAARVSVATRESASPCAWGHWTAGVGDERTGCGLTAVSRWWRSSLCGWTRDRCGRWSVCWVNRRHSHRCSTTCIYISLLSATICRCEDTWHSCA